MVNGNYVCMGVWGWTCGYKHATATEARLCIGSAPQRFIGRLDGEPLSESDKDEIEEAEWQMVQHSRLVGSSV